MSQVVPQLGEYLTKVGYETIIQLVVLLGPLLFLAFIMHFLSLLNQKLSTETMGEKAYIYLFGWLGTSFHEFGHALFAVLFGHKIKEIKLFKPNKESGTLGYVKHSYNSKNIYHQTGNFFIAIGPILMCIAVLVLLSVFLLKINISGFDSVSFKYGDFHFIDWLKIESKNVSNYITTILQTIGKGKSVAWWKLAIFFYCFYAVGSFITLSLSDIKSAVKGFFMIVLLFLIFNLSTLWIGNFAIETLVKISAILSIGYAIMVFAIVMQLIYIVLLTIVYLIKQAF